MKYTTRFLAGRRRGQLTDEEKAALEATIREVKVIPPRYTLIRQGQYVANSTLLVDGFMCRYVDDREGNRQLVALHIPGDFVDLHGYPLEVLDHDVATINKATVAMFPREGMKQLTETHPHLTRLLWFSTLLDAAMHREWIFRLGRLGAAGRVAHFFCEIHDRMAAVGLAEDGRFGVPLTQTDIAEACGLTSVHVNRVLRSLREAGCFEFRDSAARILDREQLAGIGEYNPGYLYLDE